ALDRLLPLVYDQLRRIAHGQMRGEHTGHTLSTTALVHEAYLRLVKLDQVQWQDRVHFFAMAARLMRRVLIDYARARTREKRGGEAIRAPLEQAMDLTVARADDVLEVEDALTRLQRSSERPCRVVESRYFSLKSVE